MRAPGKLMGRPSANLDGHGHGLAGQATRSGHRISWEAWEQWQWEWVWKWSSRVGLFVRNSRLRHV